MDSITQRQFDIWWAYYQCEPFGSHWEQVASVASMVHSNTSMLAATRGIKAETFGVIDFMPVDALSWEKRKRRANRGIQSPRAQGPIIRRAFGFR